MSNTGSKFDDLTAENEQDFKDRFCFDVGHTNKCVDDTVYEMSIQLRELAYTQNKSPSEYLNVMTVEEFDGKLRHLLQTKACNCGRTEHLS